MHVKSNQILSDTSTLHIYYPGEMNYETIFFLLTCYILLFIYIYYSIKKMDIFVSKVFIIFFLYNLNVPISFYFIQFK